MMIADCFIKWKEKFLAYGEFCSNLPKVQSILDKLCQNASVHQCIVVSLSIPSPFVVVVGDALSFCVLACKQSPTFGRTLILISFKISTISS